MATWTKIRKTSEDFIIEQAYEILAQANSRPELKLKTFAKKAFRNGISVEQAKAVIEKANN